MEKTDSRTLKRKMTEEKGWALSLGTVQESEGGITDLFSAVPMMASTQMDM